MKAIHTYFTDEDYARMGFRCGLEIHQQLDTKNKLFCHCPVGLTNREPDMRIMRHMRPTLSELGEYDRTALMEFKTRKQVIYELFSDRTCTYEMDDTPPFPLNRDALAIAIEIALLLNCKLVDEVHVTRKQYLDGSIPTGFQRTAMVGVDGWIPYKGRKIGIAALTLEEDSCREMSDEGHTITWKTDRLGTCLVECITKPDILSPAEVPEVNRLLGDLMRATGKVRRGIGSVRQDVNVSINGGTRVEIKGVSKLGWERALTHIEAMRQKTLIELSENLRGKGLDGDSIFMSEADISDIARSSSSALLRDAVSAGGVVRALSFRDCKGVFNTQVQPGVTFAEEVSGRIRVVACIDSNPNVLHSDEPGVTGLLNREWEAVKSALGAEEKDLKVILFGNVQDVETAVGEVKDRMVEAIEGVPTETRQPYPNGTTGFERILPGPDRMYPDTDTPPARVTRELVESVAAALPERPWEREERYRELGLADSVAYTLSRAESRHMFDLAIKKTDIEPRIAAHVLIRLETVLGVCKPFSKLAGEHWIAIFTALANGEISRDAVPDLVRTLTADDELSVAKVIEDLDLSIIKEDSLAGVLERLIDEIEFEGPASAAAHRFVMGRLRESIGCRFLGREAGELVAGEIAKHSS